METNLTTVYYCLRSPKHVHCYYPIWTYPQFITYVLLQIDYKDKLYIFFFFLLNNGVAVWVSGKEILRRSQQDGYEDKPWVSTQEEGRGRGKRAWAEGAAELRPHGSLGAGTGLLSCADLASDSQIFIFLCGSVPGYGEPPRKGGGQGNPWRATSSCYSQTTARHPVGMQVDGGPSVTPEDNCTELAGLSCSQTMEWLSLV